MEELYKVELEPAEIGAIRRALVKDAAHQLQLISMARASEAQMVELQVTIGTLNVIDRIQGD